MGLDNRRYGGGPSSSVSGACVVADGPSPRDNAGNTPVDVVTGDASGPSFCSSESAVASTVVPSNWRVVPLDTGVGTVLEDVADGAGRTGVHDAAFSREGVEPLFVTGGSGEVLEECEA